jgi:hypothetical protein
MTPESRANFVELRKAEVRRIPLLRTRVHKGEMKGRDYSESAPSFVGAPYASMPANASRRLREPRSVEILPSVFERDLLAAE